MQGIYEDVGALGGEVLVVSFTPPRRVAAYLAKYPKPFPVVSDPELRAYRGFGLERSSLVRMLRPDVVVRYVRTIMRGWLPALPGQGEDVLQLGGDFILDAAGRIVYAHPSRDPTDRPSAATLLEALRRAAGA